MPADWPFWLFWFVLLWVTIPLATDLCLWGWDAYRAHEQQRRFADIHYPGLVH